MKNNLISQQFTLTGVLKGFIFKDGYKIKYLRLEVNNIEYWIKVNKEHRQQLEQLKSAGIEIKVTGTKELCHKTGKMKLKANFIHLIGSEVINKTAPCPKAQPASILICQKSTCWKQGGAVIYAELTENLAKCGLSDQVKVKTTGCLKKCKNAPNLVFMPDRAYYSCVSTQEIPQLLAEHIQTNIALHAREEEILIKV